LLTLYSRGVLVWIPRASFGACFAVFRADAANDIVKVLVESSKTQFLHLIMSHHTETPPLLCLPDAVGEVGGFDSWSFIRGPGDFPWGRPNREIVHQRETKSHTRDALQPAYRGWSVPTEECGYFRVSISLPLLPDDIAKAVLSKFASDVQ